MKSVILDFDGTLANSFDVVIRIFSGWSTDRPRLTNKEIERLRNMPARQVLRELHIPFWRAPWLIAKGRREMRHHLEDVELFAGWRKTLLSLEEHNVRLFIVSTNSEANIRSFLRKHRIEDFFEGVYGSVGIFGKANRLHYLIQRHRMRAGQLFYVGDEVRDIEAARSADATAVSVTWGFNSQEVLAAHQPDYLIHRPIDLVQVVKDQR